MSVIDYIGGIKKIKFLYENLNKGLIRTYDIETCEKHLKKKFKNIKTINPYTNNPYYNAINCINKKDYFYIELYSDFENYKQIETYVYNLCGWWTSFIILNIKDKRFPLKPAKIVDFKNYSNHQPRKIGTNLYLDEYLENIKNHEYFYIDTIELMIEQKFTSIQNLNYGTELFHVSNLRYLNKIIKNGLIPKNNTNHPDRIYLTTDFDFAKNTSDEINGIIYRLNFKKYSKEIFNNFTFYDDPHHKNAIFTLDCINPKYIQILLNNKWIDILDLTDEQINKIINN